FQGFSAANPQSAQDSSTAARCQQLSAVAWSTPSMADGPQSGRIPPHDLTAERAVIGGILLMNEALNTVTELPLEAAHFYKDAHALIYESMIELFAANQPVDTVTLRE